MKVTVKAKPGARAESVKNAGGNVFEISVKAPPRNGLANKAIAKALADYFKTTPSNVRLVSGFSSKMKVFEVW